MKRKFKIYYRRNPEFRLDNALKIFDIVKEQTHVHVKDIMANDVESCFYFMQGEVWSPNGEARPLIEKLGLHHTSMSVGDVVHDVDANIFWQVNFAGWEEVRS